MEDLRRYIESGVLELYVLDNLNPDERAEVDAMAQKFPEIKQEILEIELALEAFAKSQGIEPDQQIRTSLLSTLNLPVLNEVRTLKSEGSVNTNFYRYAFAASVALLLISWTALIMTYTRLEDSKRDIVLLQSSNQQYSNQIKQVSQQLLQSQTTVEVLNDPGFKLITLKGTEISPGSNITVAFNPVRKLVMLNLKGVEMPRNDSQHQYQLWAMVNGKPVDLGLFDVNDTASGMIKMKPVSNPEAFAVTLEKRGGSAEPTMENLMVMGVI